MTLIMSKSLRLTMFDLSLDAAPPAPPAPVSAVTRMGSAVRLMSGTGLRLCSGVTVWLEWLSPGRPGMAAAWPPSQTTRHSLWHFLWINSLHCVHLNPDTEQRLHSQSHGFISRLTLSPQSPDTIVAKCTKSFPVESLGLERSMVFS